MRLDIISIFPEYFAPLDVSLLGKARRNGLIDMTVHDLRQWTHDRHRTVDDTPYGGGPGMVMKPEPWGEALDTLAPPAASEPQPDPASAQPETPSAQPAEASGQPAASSSRPETSGAQPPAAAAQPSASSDQQPTSTASETSSAQSAAASGQPAASSSRPETSSAQPPAAATRPSASSDQQPTSTAPETSGAQPPGVTAQPAASTTQPDAASAQPAAASGQPDTARVSDPLSAAADTSAAVDTSADTDSSATTATGAVAGTGADAEVGAGTGASGRVGASAEARGGATTVAGAAGGGGRSNAGGRGVVPRLIVPTPSGRPFTQALAVEYAAEPWLIFACGRYEGIDSRVVEEARSRMRVDEVSLGDFVLAGGEVAVLVMVEAISRLLPGVLGNFDSVTDDSFAPGAMESLLEGPVYTKPPVWRERAVPDVLLSGNHGAIARWRRDQALRRTVANRPELAARLDPDTLDKHDRQVLADAGFPVDGEPMAH